jgi:hypothetical protein
MYADAEVVPVYRSRKLQLAMNYDIALRSHKIWLATADEFEAWKELKEAHQFEEVTC